MSYITDIVLNNLRRITLKIIYCNHTEIPWVDFLIHFLDLNPWKLFFTCESSKLIRDILSRCLHTWWGILESYILIPWVFVSMTGADLDTDLVEVVKLLSLIDLEGLK